MPLTRPLQNVLVCAGVDSSICVSTSICVSNSICVSMSTSICVSIYISPVSFIVFAYVCT